MALPNPGMSVSAFDVLPAATLNQIIANIQALYAGTAFDGSSTISSVASYVPYKFLVYRNGAFTASASIFAIMPFDTKKYDTGTNFSTTSALFTAPVSGYYKFDATHTLNFSAGTQHAVTCLYINGVEAMRGSEADITVGSLSPVSQSGNYPVVFLNAGDTVGSYYSQTNSNGVYTGLVFTRFGGYMVSK